MAKLSSLTKEGPLPWVAPDTVTGLISLYLERFHPLETDKKPDGIYVDDYKASDGDFEITKESNGEVKLVMTKAGLELSFENDIEFLQMLSVGNAFFRFVLERELNENWLNDLAAALGYSDEDIQDFNDRDTPKLH